MTAHALRQVAILVWFASLLGRVSADRRYARTPGHGACLNLRYGNDPRREQKW